MINKLCEFDIKEWSAWGLGELSQVTSPTNIKHGKPNLDTLSGMIKRRMPYLSKCIYAMQNSLSVQHVPTVFASKNAELNRTFKIVRSFDSDVSPTQFCMSVNNAVAGLLSVINADKSNYTVIDSLSGVLETALVEAASMLKQHEYVKVLYFDDELPKEMESISTEENPNNAFVFLLKRGNKIQLFNQDNPTKKSHHSVKELVDFLSKNTHDYQSSNSRLKWIWRFNENI